MQTPRLTFLQYGGQRQRRLSGSIYTGCSSGGGVITASLAHPQTIHPNIIVNINCFILTYISTSSWWSWWDLNPHARRREFLRLRCIPIPPHDHFISKQQSILPTVSLLLIRLIILPLVRHAGVEPATQAL